MGLKVSRGVGHQSRMRLVGRSSAANECCRELHKDACAPLGLQGIFENRSGLGGTEAARRLASDPGDRMRQMRQKAFLCGAPTSGLQFSEESCAKKAVSRPNCPQEYARRPLTYVPSDSRCPSIHQHPHSVPQRGSHRLRRHTLPQPDHPLVPFSTDKSVEQKKSIFLGVKLGRFSP